MADPSATLCKYFASGCCYAGSDCHFSHDRSSRPDNVCYYYLKGNCFYGDRCRYDHVNADRSSHNGRHQNIAANQKVRARYIPVGPSEDPSDEKDSAALNLSPRIPPSSYAQAAGGSSSVPVVPCRTSNSRPTIINVPLCQYGLTGICPVGETCEFRHGDLCEICQCQVLDPFDSDQRLKHEIDCVAAFERDMENTFAAQRSSQMSCSICMERVLDDEDKKKRFGILEKCGHTFCLDCIMTWRKQSKELLDSKVIRSCPECRVHSDYVIPSYIWPENEKQKEEIISAHKIKMKEKHCKHYDNGRGTCPFGGKCWFLHALPDGKVVTLPDPKPRRKLHGDGTSSGIRGVYNLSDFLALSDDEEDDSDGPYYDNEFFSDYEYDDDDELSNNAGFGWFMDLMEYGLEYDEDDFESSWSPGGNAVDDQGTTESDEVLESVGPFFDREQRS